MTAKAPPLPWIWGGPAERLAWRRYWIRDVAQGLWALFLQGVLAAGTIGWCSGLGEFLGLLFGRIYRDKQARACANIIALRPDLEPQLEAVLRSTWASMGRTLAEFSVIDRLWTSSRVRVEGMEHLEAARAAGRPRVVASMHLANWELVGPKFVTLGEDAVSFFQPVPNRFRRWIATRLRRRFAGQLLPPGARSALVAHRVLAERCGAVIIYVDEMRGGRVMAPAFGRAHRLDGNMGRAVRMAHMTGGLILPAYVLREGGARFCLRILPPRAVRVTPAGDLDLEQSVKDLDSLFDPIVRAHLDQWLMLPSLDLETGNGPRRDSPQG